MDDQQKVPGSIFAKGTLFHDIKFITGHKMLDDFTSKKSIGHVAMKHLMVRDKTRKPGFWYGYKHYLHTELNKQRNVVINLVKTKFLGMIMIHWLLTILL